MSPHGFAFLILGIMFAAALTIGVSAVAAAHIGPGADQGMLLGTVALAAALLMLRQRR